MAHAGKALPPKQNFHLLNTTAGMIRTADIDPCRLDIAYSTFYNKVFVDNCITAESHQIPVLMHDLITSLSVRAGKIATTDTKCALRAFNIKIATTSQPRCVTSQQSILPSYCELSNGADWLAVVYNNPLAVDSSLVVYNQTDLRPACTWHDKSKISSISFSPNGRYIFLIAAGKESGQKFVAVKVETGIEQASITANSTSSKFPPALCSDDNGDHVLIKDDTSLCVWNVNNPDVPVKILPSYTGPASCGLTSKSCAISKDGSLAVATMLGNVVGLWDTRRKVRIATLTGNTAVPLTCTISADNSSVFTVAYDNRVCQWDIAGEPKDVSLMSEVLGQVIIEPSLLTEQFLTNNIRAKNITSAVDLFAGHNLVLLAIRAGVITAKNIHQFGGSRSYLRDNLYWPATELELVEKNQVVGDAILRHAESVEILEYGHNVKIACEMECDDFQRNEILGEVAADLAKRICSMEEYTATLEERALEVHPMTSDFLPDQEEVRESYLRMAWSLQVLNECIDKGYRCEKAVHVAGLLLNFITLVGNAVGEAAYTATVMLCDMEKKDLVAAWVPKLRAMVGDAIAVDLSNLQVAQLGSGLRNVHIGRRR